MFVCNVQSVVGKRFVMATVGNESKRLCVVCICVCRYMCVCVCVCECMAVCKKSVFVCNVQGVVGSRFVMASVGNEK